MDAVRAIASFVWDPLSATRMFERNHGSALKIRASRKKTGPAIHYHFTRDAHARDILSRPDIFQSGPIIVRSKTNSYNNKLRENLLTVNGGQYRHYRKLVAPHFRRKLVDKAAARIFTATRTELDTWPTGETCDLNPLLSRLAKRLALSALYLETDVEIGLRAADGVEAHGRAGSLSPRSYLSAFVRPAAINPLDRIARQAHHGLCQWAETHRGMPLDRDIISAIVNAPDEHGCPAGADRIASYSWIMLGAAFDTSSSALSWILLFLAHHPEVAQRLVEELRNADFDPQADLPGLMRLPYMDAVVNEAMRLVPPVPFQRRQAKEPVTVGDVEVADHALVYVSSWLVNRDPDLYPDPERFNPQRWGTINPTPYQWLPFSAGPRRCLGLWFGYAFVKAGLAGILTRWHPSIPDGSDIGMRMGVTLRATPRLPVTLNRPDRDFTRARLKGGAIRQLRLDQVTD